MRFVKLWGLERSATNFTYWSVKDNLNCTPLSNILGWKHMELPSIDISGVLWDNPDESSTQCGPQSTPQLPLIVNAHRLHQLGQVFIIKEPLAWIISFSNYKSGFSFTELADKWNRTTSNYLSVYNKWNGPKAMIDYYSLLIDHTKRMKLLARQLSIPCNSDQIVERIRTMSRGGDLTISKQAEVQRRFTRKTYYLSRQYLTCYEEDELRDTKEAIDWSLYDAVKAIDSYDPEG